MSEWKAMRTPFGTRTATGVPVELRHAPAAFAADAIRPNLITLRLAVAMLSRTGGVGLIGAVRIAERVIEVLAGGNVALATLRVCWWSFGRRGGVG